MPARFGIGGRKTIGIEVISARMAVAMFGSMIVVISLLFLLVASYFFMYRPILSRLISQEAQRVNQNVEGEISTFFSRVEAVCLLNRLRGSEGQLDLSSLSQFNALLRPIVETDAPISAAAVADETGREVSGAVKAPGLWVNRLTDPARQGARGRFLVWRDRDVEADEERETGYDARQRPWFQGAMGLPDESQVFWTKPHAFASTGEVGLSAAVRWLGQDGRKYVMSFDVPLVSLTQMIQGIVVGKSGMTTVLTEAGAVIALPRASHLRSVEAIKGALLKDGTEIGVPALAQALDQWRAAGQDLKSFQVGVDGEEWIVHFFPSQHGSQTFWIVTLIPKVDVNPMPRFALPVFAILIAITLSLALVAAKPIAMAYTRPLELLASESDRIGRLELEEPITVHSRVRELEIVIRAQERMRLRLIEATQAIEAAAHLQVELAEERVSKKEELLRAAEELRKSNERFKVAVDFSPIGMALTSLEGAVLYTNDAFRKIHGYQRGSIPTEEEWYAVVYPDPAYRAELLAEWNRRSIEARAGNGEITPMEVRVTCRDGRVKTLILSAAYLPDALLSTFYDVTETIELVTELEDLNRNYEELLDSVAEIGVIVVDSNGIVTLFNSGAENMLGYSADEIVGRAVSPAKWHVPQDVASRAAELSAELGRPVQGTEVFTAIPRRDGIERREWTMLRKDGSRVLASLVVRPVRSRDGLITGYLGIAMDVTSVKSAAVRRSAAVSQFRKRIETLTQREREILEGIVAGKTSKAIAFHVGLSVRTVDFYRMQIASKLGVSGVSNLVRMSLEAGVAPGPLWPTDR
jgi:two-component system sensor histidine kinase/response regulator